MVVLREFIITEFAINGVDCIHFFLAEFPRRLGGSHRSVQTFQRTQSIQYTKMLLTQV